MSQTVESIQKSTTGVEKPHDKLKPDIIESRDNNSHCREDKKQ